jgi:hypothetical protein
MPDHDYISLRLKIGDAGTAAGVKLAEILGDKKDLANSITERLISSVINDSLDVADIIRGVVDTYGSELGLEDKYLEYIRDGAKVIDAAVGQIRLDISGKLSGREKELILALLQGLKNGLST